MPIMRETAEARHLGKMPGDFIQYFQHAEQQQHAIVLSRFLLVAEV